MNEVIRALWCSVKANREFFSVKTYSGYRSQRADPRGVEHLLPPGATDMQLGSAVLDALRHSRFVLPAPQDGVWIHPDATFDMDLYDYQASNRRYAQWIADMLEKYEYKSRRALFKGMKSCNLEAVDGYLTIRPLHHDKLEGWSEEGISSDDYVALAINERAERVGGALRLALGRCT